MEKQLPVTAKTKTIINCYKAYLNPPNSILLLSQKKKIVFYCLRKIKTTKALGKKKKVLTAKQLPLLLIPTITHHLQHK